MRASVHTHTPSKCTQDIRWKSNPEELPEGGVTLEGRWGGSCQLYLDVYASLPASHPQIKVWVSQSWLRRPQHQRHMGHWPWNDHGAGSSSHKRVFTSGPHSLPVALTKQDPGGLPSAAPASSSALARAEVPAALKSLPTGTAARCQRPFTNMPPSHQMEDGNYAMTMGLPEPKDRQG